MFKVECLGCQAPYQVDERRVPEKGLKMRCPKCGTTFKVEPPTPGAPLTDAPAAEPELPVPSVPKPQEPFTSAGIDAGGMKIGKPPTGRDSLARTMIGVSSAELDPGGKDAGTKPKAFRIPRPNQGAAASPPAAAAPAAPVTPPEAEVDLPATPARARSLGLAPRGPMDNEVALPELVSTSKRAAQHAGEVQVVLPSAAPAADASWIGGEEVVDAPPSLGNPGAPLQLSELPQPVAARSPAELASSPSSELPSPLELDLGDDLPIVASGAKRPPPRRARPITGAAPAEEPADLPARLEDVEVGLPAPVAPAARALDRAPRPPSRQKGGSSLDELDLPAIPPRVPAAAGPPPPPPRALPKPAAKAPSTVADLPSVPRARPEKKGLSDDDLPAIGRGRPDPGAGQPAVFGEVPAAQLADDLPSVLGGDPRARPTASDLPSVLGGDDPRTRPTLSDLPSVLGAPPPARPAPPARPVPIPDVHARPTVSDLPSVFGGDPRARPTVSDLPSVLGGGRDPGPPDEAAHDMVALPEVLAPGLPVLPGGGLPAVSSGRAGLPDLPGGSLPAISGGRAGLPDVLSAGLPTVSAAGLPAVSASGLPTVSSAGLPAVQAAGLPVFQDTGLPDVLAAGLPEVSATGLPDVTSAGLPIVQDTGLPEVLGVGVAGFGRVDLPVPRPAELPTAKSGHLGFDEVDLPGVGEALPSVAGGWNDANLPLVGDALPVAKTAFDDADNPFGAFEPAGEGDPFAGSEADFGAQDADPFAAPAEAYGDSDEFAPQQEVESPEGRAGGGYGEVDIGAPGSSHSPLETADDSEFDAVPQRTSGTPGRAAASASVHADAPDTEAAGSTLELGPERKAPKARRRRIAALAAVCLATIGGGALALSPALGPFGIHFVVDQIKRGEHERLLGKLVEDARDAEHKDIFDGVQGAVRAIEKARESAPRFTPLIARSALHHYKAVLRFGPLPNLETTAKVALDQLDPSSNEVLDRTARAARAAAAHAADAKAQLEALGGDPDARELLGELSLQNGDWAGAKQIWTELRTNEPKSARAAYGLARAQLGLGQLAEATELAKQVLALNPEHVGAPILLLEVQRAALHQQKGKAQDSASTEALAAAVARVLPNASPGEATLAHCVLGELHASQGRSQPAQQEFEAALVIDRTSPRALIGLGEVLHQSGRYTEALARFEAAARAEPASLAAQLGIAKSQIQLAHLPEAKAILARLSESRKDEPDVIYWMARAQQALGENDAAMATYRAAIAAGKGRPDSVEAYLALAKLQADLGQLAAAQDTLSEARAKLPPTGALYKALGEIAMSRAEYAAAYEQFQKALDLESGDTRARFLGAVALARLGRFDEALAAFQTVGQTDKDFPGLAVERGRLFEEAGRNAEALAEFEAALAKTPDDPDVQIRVGCSRVIAGQAASAEPLLEKASKARPRSAESQFCLGRAQFEQERYPDAMQRIDRALSIDASRAMYHLYRGWIATEMGRQGDAQDSFDKAIELDKGMADAYWLRGRLRLKQGAAKDAILDLERARELKPTRYDAIADLAVAYADIGRMPKSLDLWEEALAKDPDNATWHFRYGKLLSSAGNGQMAAAHIRRAIELLNEAESSLPPGSKPKPPLWLWQAHYLLGRELGAVPAAIPHWQAYLRLSPRDDPYRPEAERALKTLGQPWGQR